MRRLWQVRLVDQDRGTEGLDLERLVQAQRGGISLSDDLYHDQPAVTFELLCNNEVVFALHSPSKRNAQGEVFRLTLIDGRYPLDVLRADMEEHGMA